MDELINGDGPIYLFWPVLMGFLRVATSRSILSRPLLADEAEAAVESLIGLPNVRTGTQSRLFWAYYRRIANRVSLAGNLVPDAQIVALMLENGVSTLATRDREFLKFNEIVVIDPFSA